MEMEDALPSHGSMRSAFYFDALQRAQRDASHLSIPGVSVEKVSADGVPCEWLRADTCDPRSVVLYLHGGGYVSCSLLTHRQMMSRMSATSKVAVLGVDYRLAPLHPFPCAVEDALRAYEWLLEHGYEAGRIVFAGDSAGGGLVFATLLLIKQENQKREKPIPMPAATVTFSPWTDMSITGKSIAVNYETDKLFNPLRIKITGFTSYFQYRYIRFQWRLFARMYVQWPKRLSNPMASPLFGDLTGLPPAMIHCSAEEMLMDDSLRMEAKLREDGVSVSCKIWDEGIHVFPVSEPASTRTSECLADVAHFVQTALQSQKQASPGNQHHRGGQKELANVRKSTRWSTPKPRYGRPVARPLSLWVLATIMLPGLLWAGQSFWKVALHETLAIIGFYIISWRLRRFHERLHERLQRRVHERINKMYMHVYNGQSIEHPYMTNQNVFSQYR